MAAALLWLVPWAVGDITIVEGVFRETGRWDLIGRYHLAYWWVVFVPATFVAFRRHAWAPLALWLSGWEDAMYFWLQGSPVPASLPWLWQATDAGLYLAMAAAMAAAVAVAFVRGRRA